MLVLHGEPGHGKTLLCQRAMLEFKYRDKFKTQKNVFWFQLNPAHAPKIIENNRLVLENAFCHGRKGRYSISSESCKGSLIFLDGYDELKSQAANTDISSFDMFYEEAVEIAEEYNMHVVITTRTMSIQNELRYKNFKSLQFSPLTEESRMNG